MSDDDLFALVRRMRRAQLDYDNRPRGGGAGDEAEREIWRKKVEAEARVSRRGAPRTAPVGGSRGGAESSPRRPAGRHKVRAWEGQAVASERFRWQYLAWDTEIVHYLFDGHERTDFAVFCYPGLPADRRFMVCRWAPAGWAPATARDAKGHATEGRAKGRAIRLYLASLGTPTPAGP